jgi:hypothetical protein
MGKNVRSPSTEPHVDSRPTYNGVQLSSPRGSLTTKWKVLCWRLHGTGVVPQCHEAFGTIPSTLAWVDQSPVSSSNPQQGIPSTPATASHMTQGRVEYESTTPWSSDEGLDLWEVIETDTIVSCVMKCLCIEGLENYGTERTFCIENHTPVFTVHGLHREWK